VEASTLRQQQGARSREEILDAAERLMSERGFAAASISQLSKACGLPASSIYWHFGSKDGVLAAVMDRGAARFFADLPRVSNDNEPGPQAIAAFFDALADRLDQHPDFLRLLMTLGLTHHGDEDTASSQVQHNRDIARSRLDELLQVAYPHLPPARVTALTAFALATIDGAFLNQQIDRPTVALRDILATLAPAIDHLANRSS